MKALLTGTFLAAALVTSAQAKTRMPVNVHALVRPYEQTATACFAETIAANPRATALARANRWYEAAGLTGFLCRPEVDALIHAHDGLKGPGTGFRYFQTIYIRNLERDLASRLQWVMKQESLANAESLVEKTSWIDAGAESVRQKSQ